MLKFFALVAVLVLNCHAFPRYHRLRREADSALKYGPCKNTYDQCPEWKGEGMCTSAQYKDYMMTVCPVTCEFCRESDGGENVGAKVASVAEETDKEATGNSPNPAPYTPEQSTEQSNAVTEQSSEQSSSPSAESQSSSSDATTEDSVQQVAVPNEQQQQQQTESRQNVGSTNVENSNPSNSNDDEYQTMLKHYYENVQKQQAEYQKSIAQSYPEYQTQPGVSNSESSNSNTVEAAVPASSPATNSAPPAQAAPLPSPPSQSAPAVAPASLPDNVPNPMAAATGQTSPIVINSAEAEQYDPSKTSSALYNKNNNNNNKEEQDSKPEGSIGNSKFKTQNKANSTADSDEATNEKVKSESKHIEQTIKSAKEKRISAEKQLKKKGVNKLVTDKSAHRTPAKIMSPSSSASANDTTAEEYDDDDDDDDDDQDEDIQGYDSKRTNLTAPSSVADPSNSNADTKSNVAADSAAGALGSGSSSNSDDASNEDAEEENESGSGGDTGLDDLHELSMLMSLNYNDDDNDGGFATDDVDVTAAENKALTDTDNNNNEYSNNNDVLDSAERMTRDQIVGVPSEMHVTGDSASASEATDDTDEAETADSGSGDLESGDANSDETTEVESGASESETENKQETEEKEESNKKENTASMKNQITNIASQSSPIEEPAETDSAAGNTVGTSSGSSGQSESEPEDEEDPVDEEGSARDEEALPLQSDNQKLKQSSKGSISLVLRQNFQSSYKNTETPSYQMLSGNVKKDFEKVLKRAKVRDVSFSEANIEGNPRQTGKTKVTFHLNSNDNAVMKALTKLVDSGNINGLSVVSGSLEFDE